MAELEVFVDSQAAAVGYAYKIVRREVGIPSQGYVKLLREVVERIDLRRNPWKDFSLREEQKKTQLQI